MVTGGGEDFAGGFGQREAELDLADLERGSGVCTEQVGYGGLLTDQAAGEQFEVPFDFHALLLIARGDYDAGHADRTGGTGMAGHIGVAFAGHGIEGGFQHAAGLDVGHGELGEELDAGAAQHHALLADPAFGLGGQDRRPGGVVERAGHALRLQGVIGGQQGVGLGQRAAPVDDVRQIAAGKHQTDRHIGGGLGQVDGGECGAVSGGAGESGGVLGHIVSFDVCGFALHYWFRS